MVCGGAGRESDTLRMANMVCGGVGRESDTLRVANMVYGGVGRESDTLRVANMPPQDWGRGRVKGGVTPSVWAIWPRRGTGKVGVTPSGRPTWPLGGAAKGRGEGIRPLLSKNIEKYRIISKNFRSF
jgi:hypothetical protein